MEISLVFLEYVGGNDAGKGLECHEIIQPISWGECSWCPSARNAAGPGDMGNIPTMSLISGK